MDIERNKTQLVISLSSEEVFAVQAGKIIGERGGIVPESKVEILPLSSLMPDDSNKDRWTDERLKMAATIPLVTRLFENQDLQIAIPEIVLSDVRVTGRTVTKSEIIVNNNNDELRNTVPDEGIQINFGGSLKIIDLYNFLIS